MPSPKHSAWIVGMLLMLPTPGVCGEPSSLPADDVRSATSNSRVPEVTNTIGMKLVQIRAGNFLMGAVEGHEVAEKPRHRVRFKKPFLMGKFEVTRGEFRKFADAANYKTLPETDEEGAMGYTNNPRRPFKASLDFSWRNVGFAQTDKHPVVNVTWDDAVKFCEWLSKEERKIYRLPSEAEWEWACRAGSIERYNLGDDASALELQVNLADLSLNRKMMAMAPAKWDDGFPFTAAVGSFKPNRFGLHDMHGNVREWCGDWFDREYYSKGPIHDPRGPAMGEMRVCRGGGWLDSPETCRSACRMGLFPSERAPYVGFRVICEVLEKSPSQ